MMTNVLLGSYPDVFAAGSAWAGVAFGCFAGNGYDVWSNECATGQIKQETHLLFVFPYLAFWIMLPYAGLVYATKSPELFRFINEITALTQQEVFYDYSFHGNDSLRHQTPEILGFLVHANPSR